MDGSTPDKPFRSGPWSAGLLALGAMMSAAWAPAQASRNVELLGRLDPHAVYSDVWGYAAPGGREYALLATDRGTSVIDCTDPRAPVERGFIPGPPSTLRDIRTYGTRAYVVTEGGGGFQIIDLADPDNPTLITTWGGSSFSHAHNLAIDIATGRIYVVGTDVGTVVFDASSAPTAPPPIGVYGSASITEYVHDLHVQNGIGHASMVWTGEYRLLDVTTWPLQTLAAPRTPGATAHNAWPNATDTLSVTTDERAGGLVQLWDIADPTRPIPLGAFTPDTGAVLHNAYLVGDLCHASWFTEGYRVLDVSEPMQPVELGFYDTYSGPPGSSEGAFGCYPFQPSGAVYVSDRTAGLFVLRPHRLRIRHVRLGDTMDEDGPYSVVATVTSQSAIASIDLFWSVDGAGTTRVAMQPTGNPDEFAADIPGQLAPARVSYYLDASDVAGGSFRDPRTPTVHEFDVGRRVHAYLTDFEGSPAWTHGGAADDWERGTPAGMGGNARGSAWHDARAAASGTNAWGNDLGLAGAPGIYPTRASSWLQSPLIPTLGLQGLELRFKRWLTVEDGARDRALVLINGQTVWQNPTGRHQLDFAWNDVVIDVASITDSASTATIRFELRTDGDLELGGWNLDDVELVALSDCVPPVHYGAGTAGTGGVTPAIDLEGDPRLGNRFRITGSAMASGSGAFLLLGIGTLSQPISGITALVDPTLGAIVFVPVGPAGTTSLPLGVPDLAALDNLDLFTQWVVLEPGGQLAASDGMRVRVCRR